MYDKSIVSHKQARYMYNSLVLSTVESAIKTVPYKYRKGLILHSDQGFQFTGVQYGNLLKNNKIIRSVSAKGSLCG